MNYSEQYKKAYLSLPEKLAAHYPELNFDNHCYLRIALDNLFGARWDTKISRPAYKNLEEEQLGKVQYLLNCYFEQKDCYWSTREILCDGERKAVEFS